MCLIAIYEIKFEQTSLNEKNDFMLAFKRRIVFMGLKLHLCDSNHEAIPYKAYRKELAKSLRKIT